MRYLPLHKLETAVANCYYFGEQRFLLEEPAIKLHLMITRCSRPYFPPLGSEAICFGLLVVGEYVWESVIILVFTYRLSIRWSLCKTNVGLCCAAWLAFCTHVLTLLSEF